MHAARLMRARINDRLERASRFPVTLIVAPAGFGKSVALRDFLLEARISAVRFNLRREDGNLLAFVRHLSEALADVAPTAIASFQAIGEGALAADEPVRRLSDWLSEHLKDCACTIAIDDLHYAATDPASVALLADVIERTCDRIAWIIAARSDLGLPVASWVAYGRMDIPVGEDDLRFTTGEALEAAELAQTGLDLQEIEALRHLTEGWPVALTIALRTRTHSADLRSASSGTREMVYRYLAEQVFAALTPQQRRFALATSAFSAFDSAIAAQLGADARFLLDFRRQAAFLNETSPDEYRYHDLFRDFLETELRRSGDAVWKQSLCDAAQILEDRKNDSGALALYTKARAVVPMLRVISHSGFSMFERGELEPLRAALEAIPEDESRGHAPVLGIRAMLEASRGRFDLAQRDFLAAIKAAADDRDLCIRLVGRYAIELVRHDRDCLPFLEPYANDTAIPEHMRLPLLGTLATGYMRANRKAQAVKTMREALDLADNSLDREMLARLYQQAAYVHHGQHPDRARTYAEQAVALALSQNLYEVASRAYSVLYSLAYEDDDPQTCLAILRELEQCARKGASTQARLFALIGSYEIEVERGDTTAIGRLDPAVRESRAIFPQAYAQALLPAEALRASWIGDFREAYDLLATGEPLGSADRRALRSAEIALYAAAAGLHDEADAALRDAAQQIDETRERSRRITRAQLFLALAELVRGRAGAAHQRLSVVERALPQNARHLRAFANAVRALYREHLSQGENGELDAAIERLEHEHFGGLARMLRALPVAETAEGGYAALTPAEREILTMLAKGASTKDVAERTGRSPHTVDTHIRSICRKLHCSGRREAVALATSAGWVHA